MIERIRPRKIVCRASPRKRLSRMVMFALPLLGCAIGPVLHSAQASRRAPSRVDSAHEQHADVPGSITLAEMIEIQKRKRLRSAAPVAGPADWRAQFGAFADAGAAEALRADLAGALAGTARVEVVPGGGFYRVLAPTANAASAEAVCARVRAGGTACFTAPR